MDKPEIIFDCEIVKPISQQLREAEGMRDYFLWKSVTLPWSRDSKYFADIAAGWQKDIDKLKDLQDVNRRTVGNYADKLKP